LEAPKVPLGEQSTAAPHRFSAGSEETDAADETRGTKGGIKKEKDKGRQTKIELLHCDIIKDAFWDERFNLLA
jgi:hypothetical protein